MPDAAVQVQLLGDPLPAVQAAEEEDDFAEFELINLDPLTGASRTCPEQLLRLGRRLSVVGSLSGEGRINLAFRLGFEVAQIHRGERVRFSERPLGTPRQRIFVILEPVRACATSKGELRASLASFAARTNFFVPPFFVGFPSQAEATAFSVGAGLPALPPAVTSLA
jgi:hypothetical protein